MEHITFCKSIGLPSAALDVIRCVSVDEAEFFTLKNLFFQDISAFQRQVMAHRNWKQRFLFLYTRLASEAFEEYQKRSIPEDVFWDTFSDFKLWYENCLRDFDEPGLAEYDWLWRHIRLLLFRLGRLQFMPLALPAPLHLEKRRLPAGAVVLDTHIPQGEPLDIDKVYGSFRRALSFFHGVYPVFSCHSWLLYPALKEILPGSSRILQFQQLFQIVHTDEADRQAEERIFGKISDDPRLYSESTALQRTAKRHLLEGKRLGSARGVFWFHAED